MRRFAILLCCALPALAQYGVNQTGDIVELRDAAHGTEVRVATTLGNMAYEMKVRGENVIFFPYASLDEFRARPGFGGNPFLAPWANRLDELAFYANGKRYAFNMSLANVRAPQAVHGLLMRAAEWQVVDKGADARSAWVTSRLEFYRYPQWMAQFPFAHTIEITHRLSGGVLEVQTRLHNMSAEPMPVSIGFHPYFRVADAPRDEWRVELPARTQWLLTPEKLPTGATEPIEKLCPTPRAVALKDYRFDHVFADLDRDAQGRATVAVQGKKQRVEVVLGANYRALVVFSPGAPAQSVPNAPARDWNFIALEPMVAITNALNLAHKGIYKELQSVAPGATWAESFWVRPSGF